MLPFWGNVISQITTLDAQDLYSGNNFSGQHSASLESHAAIIGEYLLANYSFTKYCDIGGSKGTLAGWLANRGKHAFVIDGCDRGWRENRTTIARENYAVFDMSGDIKPYIGKKEFDLTTSIEFTEHVPEGAIDAVFANIAHMCHIHVCTLHVAGAEAENHYTIRPADWWMERISKFGEPRRIDNLNVPTFNQSVWLEIKF